MAPDHDLVILHDARDLETASRIAASLAGRGITAELEEIGEQGHLKPGYITPEDLVVLVISHARSNWGELAKMRESTHLIVADVTGDVGSGADSGGPISIPQGVADIVPMLEFESGIKKLAYVLERLGLRGDPPPIQAQTADTRAQLRTVVIVREPQDEEMAARLCDDLAGAGLEVTTAGGPSWGQVGVDLHLCVVSSPNRALCDPSPEEAEVIFLAVGDGRDARAWAAGTMVLDFTDYLAGRAALLALLSSRYGFVRRRSVGTQTGAGNDRVAQTDALGFRHYVRAFVDLMESPHTRPPLTIGIYGSWGMGKSFLLDHVIARIRENQRARAEAAKKAPKPADGTPRTPDVYVVGFNAWEYSATDVIWPGLVRKIMDTMEREVSSGWARLQRSKLRRNFVRRLKDEAPRIVASAVVLTSVLAAAFWSSSFNLQAAALTFSAVGLAGLAKVVVSTLNAPLSQWVTALFQDSDYGKQIGHMAEIRLDLELLETLLREENGRMVVAIDDLDRCEPEKTVEMLQAINLLLNFESFIVVMGIDARIVTRAIEKHYKELLGPAGASGYEYLDKIVQIPFRIPESEPATIRTFLHAQLVGGEAPGSAGARSGGHRSARGLQPADSGDVGRAGDGPGAAAGDMPASAPTLDQLLRDNVARVPGTFRKADPPRAEPPPLPTAFSADEVEAFEAAAAFLKPNPRHIKRLVNVYRLVRTLAHLRSEETILLNPAATLRWLITSGQWPYAAHAMLTHFADMEDRGTALPDGDPLPELLEHVRPLLDATKTAELDHDHDVLEALLKSGYGCATSDELKVIRRYTVNFNPAVERELVLRMQK
jgi:Cdc6-like AAA superfamily ATPase